MPAEARAGPGDAVATSTAQAAIVPSPTPSPAAAVDGLPALTGHDLAAFRARLGLTQRQLGARLGIEQGGISKGETGGSAVLWPTLRRALHRAMVGEDAVGIAASSARSSTGDPAMPAVGAATRAAPSAGTVPGEAGRATPSPPAHARPAAVAAQTVPGSITEADAEPDIPALIGYRVRAISGDRTRDFIVVASDISEAALKATDALGRRSDGPWRAARIRELLEALE